MAPPAPSVPAVPRRDAFAFWFRLGCISFGGPAGQVAIMHAELVERRRWISERRFLHALNYCMLLPGPEAQQLATYLGWLMHGTWGGIVAGALFVLPSLAVLVALSWAYVAFGATPLVASLFLGIKPAVVAIVLHAAWRIGRRVLHHPALGAIAAASLVSTAWLGLPFPWIVAAAAAVGLAGGALLPRAFRAGGAHTEVAAAHAPALIDDATPPPPHARFSRAGLARVGAGGALAWLLPLAVLVATGGWAGTLTRMAAFFTRAALVTFGGAYAVLPYVHQAAVSRYGWLSAAQMMDGLALGETTPGPLIMVVAFVGFLGAGLAGALVATWYTFLPSFLFILAGGPLVESTRGEPRYVAPLTAVSAAVVGAILALALFFGRQVLWPGGWPGAPDPVAVALALAAGVALFRFRRGVIEVIVACGVAGVAWGMLGG